VKVEDFQREKGGGRIRVSASFTFESHDQASKRLWVEVDADHDDIEASPEAFLVMGLPWACWVGEPRVRIEGPICSSLAAGLEEAMRLFASWWPHVEPIPIEASGGRRATRPIPARRTGVCMSGGADALVALIANRAAFPLDHPDAIREGFYYRGMNSFDLLPDGRMDPRRAAGHDAHVARLAKLADEADFRLTVLDTNVRTLYEDWAGYRDQCCGAATLAPAMMFGRRITDLLVASTGYGPEAPPHGSHPILDPLFSTAAIHVRLTEPLLLRHEKLPLLVSWAPGLDVLDVCVHAEPPSPGRVNCGTCQKCVRTMLGLLAMGKLHEAPTLPRDDLDEATVRGMTTLNPNHIHYLDGLIEPLEAQGRSDLARAVRHKVQRLRKRSSLRRRLSRSVRGRLPWKRSRSS
jgi:hypothetical protein